MSRRPATILQADVARSPVVYFVQIGKLVKIGYSTNLDQRLRTFATSTAEPIEVLATLSGGRDEERKLHEALKENRVHGEFFRFDFRLSNFVDLLTAGRLPDAWDWLSKTDPAARARKKVEERRSREVIRAATKAEFDAYCAYLVAGRKQRLGW